MTGLTAVAVVALAVGMSLVGSWLRARRPSLEGRLAPYVRPADGSKWVAHRAPGRLAVSQLIAPMVRDGARFLEKWGSPATDVRARLDRSGSTLSVEQLRAQQVAWAAVGLAAGVSLATMAKIARDAPLVTLLVLIVACAAGGALGRDFALSQAAKRRSERIVSELPTIADLLALSVTAGEGVRAALERVVRTTSGALPDELSRALADARAGEPLSRALESAAARTGAAPFARFVDGVVAALDLGTPLAGVLRAQAHDARIAGREQLMEAGGKREIVMLVPVVFLILPVTIVFAIFPGLIAIQLT